METIAFQKLLRTTGSYETLPEEARTKSDRLFGWLDMWYYLRLFRLIYVGHRYSLQGKFDRQGWSELSHGVMRAIEGCGGIIHISGAEHLRELHGPVVYVSNHMSMIETLLIPCLVLTFNDYLSTVIKQSLMRYPYFKTVLKQFDAITVTRENPRKDLKTVLRKGEEILKRGWAVSVFPQSTRSTSVDPEDFNTLGVKLAKKANVPIVPLALKTDFLRPGKIFRDFGRLDRSKKICFKFGEPLRVEGNGRETHEKILNFITVTLRQWQ